MATKKGGKTRTDSRRADSRTGAAGGPLFSPQTQELRTLLRRIPDGFQATLNSLAARSADERERCLLELARGMGKEALPLFRGSLAGKDRDLARSAIRILPVFGTRAAGELLVEAWPQADEELRGWLQNSAQAFQARGIHIFLGDPPVRSSEPRFTLREALITYPDGVGSRSCVVRLQDEYGVWHALMVMWNDQAGIKDGFLRPFSQREWEERRSLGGQSSTHVPCAPEYVRWLVDRARRINDRTGLVVGACLKDWDRVMGPPAPGYLPPDPRLAFLALTEGEQLEALEAGPKLLSLPEMERWFIEPADVVPWVREYLNLQEQGARRGKTPDPEFEIEYYVFLVKVANALVTAELLELFRDRLLEAARLLQWDGREQESLRAAGVAAEIGAGREAGEIRFLVALAERSIFLTRELLRLGRDLERSRYRPLRRYQG